MLDGLSTTRLEDLVRPDQRLVVIAPHPDDEVLGAGGLMALAAAAHRQVVVLAVTDGEASHPQSDPNWIRVARANERQRAFDALGLHHERTHRFSIADGEVAQNIDRLATLIEACTAPNDVVLCTWRGDGHPDHEACAAAALYVRDVLGYGLIEYPVWGWHWCTPQQFPLHVAVKLPLTGKSHRAKLAAINMFESQIADASDEPILSALTLQRFYRPFEVFLR
jgi:LmbE family N-acetylglucosaminyl deacetylase